MTRDTSELTSLLTILGRVCRARSLAVWIPVDDQLQLVGDWRLEHALVEWLRRTWSDVAPDLQAGKSLTFRTEVTLHPLLARDGALAGVLQYVGSLPASGARRDYLDESLSEIVRMLAKGRPVTSEAHRVLPLSPFDFGGSDDAFDRHAYGAWLERCGWDITHAAAILGITRQALYDRLEFLGLGRLTMRDRLDEPER